jgi:hypothetical protein
VRQLANRAPNLRANFANFADDPNEVAAGRLRRPPLIPAPQGGGEDGPIVTVCGHCKAGGSGAKLEKKADRHINQSLNGTDRDRMIINESIMSP